MGGILARQDWAALRPLIAEAGLELEAGHRLLHRFCELVLQWNRKVSNLISRNDESRIVSRHLYESIALVGWMKRPEFKRWLDFGSGGGFPAVPLAVLDVGESWTLVESRRTKTLFLRRCVQEMGLGQLDIQLMRLEDYVLDQPEPAFDAFTSRATLTLGPTLELAAAIVRPGGSAFLWKGSRRESEMAEPGTWQQSWTLAGERAISDGQTVVLEFSRRG